ncbi:HAMP domain-containing sensor histidine kinase [Aliiroseovarius sp. F20344]|uniref:sensor histidine kinase n=1 Tax=Aliiroseovarius sp. F20344 TaxID=2926414 RepID=UPI001FF1854D|nr:HAMP domain-containing sensor histidine kinase [Aliiroseovarius sp. F20344]MCK0142767.1 HAMP domain-containing histidine kinase [Aliiroseovarius sp. F20344]
MEDVRGEGPAMILRARDDLDGLPKPFERAVRRGGGTVELERALFRSDVWRVLVTKDSEGEPVMVAVPLEESEQVQELLGSILWTTALIVIALTLAIGFGAGLLAQRRIALINRTLSRLADGDLSARTEHIRAKDDLDDIARQLDTTAAELERLVSQTRHLSASIAHDLRTPLARLRAQLEMLPDGQGRSAALEEAERLSQIFDTIMRVARIEAAQGKDGFELVALDNLTTDVFEIFEAVVEDEGKKLTLETVSHSEVEADRQMLVQAMANLIQNALVHGGQNITLFAQGQTIGVYDDGAGVDPSQFGEIIKPMVRLDEARSSEGSGLGLALVRAVADRHGAKLEISQVKPQGLKVALNFADL